MFIGSSFPDEGTSVSASSCGCTSTVTSIWCNINSSVLSLSGVLEKFDFELDDGEVSLVSN